MKYKILMVIVACVAVLPARSQQPKNLTGTIVNSEGMTLSGATIALKIAGTQFVSNAQGYFNLPYNGSPDTLTISHVGYEPLTIPLNEIPEAPLIITLYKASTMMEEVILNTGYQRVPKERATGSFFQIDKSTFNQQISADVLSRLPAIASAVLETRKRNQGDFISKGNLLIRGLSTINGPQSPLIILDNFPYDGELNNINPNDVSSITILKDAAAASIWGARAGNGVIVITTKKGSFHQKTKIEFVSNFKTTGKPDLHYLKSISSKDLVNLEQFLFSKRYRFSDTASRSHPPFSPVYEILFQQRSGIISGEQAAEALNYYKSHDVRNDFNKYVYEAGFSQQYGLNISSGSGNIAWFLSGGFDQNQSVLAADYQRLTLRTAGTIQLSGKLQLGTSLFISQSTNYSGRQGYGNIRTIKGNIPVYSYLTDASGNPVPVAKDFRSVYTDTAGNGSLLDWNYYPLTDYQHNRTTGNLRDLLGNISLTYQIVGGFSAELQYQLEQQASDDKILHDENSYYTRNLVNTFYQPFGTNKYPVPKGGILDLSQSCITSHNVRSQLNFSKAWNANELTAIAGSEIKEIVSTGNTHRIYGYNSEILTQIPVDHVNAYPSFVNGNEINIPDNSGSSKMVNRFVSFFANAAYTYKQKYTASLSGRRDASNIFGVHTNDKWNPLWSAGLSWQLSKENFYRFSMMPFLKLRATYGISGNIDPSFSSVTTMIYESISPYTLTPFASIVNFYNPDLRWEKSKQWNFGFDFMSGGNRIGGSIDYWIKKGTDLYGPAPVDQTAGLGVGYITKNTANMKANGMDIVLHTVNINQKVKWLTDLDLNFYHDKITSYFLSSLQGSNFIGDGAAIAGVPGRPVHSVLSYRWAGLDTTNGNPMGYLNGEVSQNYSSIRGSGTALNDLVYSGPGLPTFYGSIGNTVVYKAFSITVRFTGKFGYYFKKDGLEYVSLFSSLNGSADYGRRWQKPGDEKTTNVPSMVYPAVRSRDAFYNGSEALVLKGDHIRLQYITVSYSFLKKNIKKLPFDNVNLYVNINDIGIIWQANKESLDPDYSTTSIPPSKNIAFGMRISL